MEREEKTQTQNVREKEDVQRGEPDSLQSLEVRNEVSTPPVKFAGKSGCGACG